MDYNSYKKKIAGFTSLWYSLDDNKIEECYALIDELEKAAQTDTRFYELVSDAYTMVLDYKKASAAFMKFYNPSDKKHIKKLYNLNNTICCPVTRPSGRAENLPSFKYTSKEAVKNLFIKNHPGKCCICGNKSDAFYIGMAFTKPDRKKICFAGEEEIFCATCLENGSAASKLNISFNSSDINGLSLIGSNKRDMLMDMTPSCSYLFENFYEDIWPSCCNDFCRYEKKEDDTFHFKCIHCKKEIIINEET